MTTILAIKMRNVDGSAARLAKMVMDKVYNKIHKLCIMWNDVGYFGNHLEERFDTVVHHVSTMFDDMIMVEEEYIDNLKTDTESLIIRAACLSQELQLPFEKPDKKLTALEIHRVMVMLIKQLEEERDYRLNDWNTLTWKIQECCKVMKTVPFEFKTSSRVPRTSDVEVLQMQANDMEWDLDKRTKQMSELKKTIKKMVGELDFKVDEHEKIFLSDDLGDLLYSNENLKLHKTFILKLEKVKKHNLTRIASYKDELKKSFEFNLEGEVGYKDGEFDHYCAASTNLARLLKQKVHERKLKIESTILTKQAELQKLWDLCQVSCQHIDEKKDLLVEIDKVDCLKLKEEISSMEKCYKDNKEIYDAIKTFRDTFADLTEAERKCVNASRRLNNVSITMEEKPKNKLLKAVLKMQDKLTSMTLEVEMKKGTKLVFKGMKLNEYFQHLHDQLKANKESWKVERTTPSGVRHTCYSGSHGTRTPTSQRKEEPKTLRRSETRLNRQTSNGQIGQQFTARAQKDGSNNGVKCIVETRPPRPTSVLRKYGQIPRVPSRTIKPCHPMPSDNVADTRLEISEIENVDDRYLNDTASYEEFFNDLAANDTFKCSSILEHPVSPKQQKHYFKSARHH